MIRAICLGLLVQTLVAQTGGGPANYVRIERLSERVVLAYWLGTGRCNLTAIQSEKGLVLIDTHMSPRVMAPIKERIEKVFGRNDWAYVIHTHTDENHAGGNCLFGDAVIVGHENLPKDMESLIRKQADPDWKRRDLNYAGWTQANLRGVLPRLARKPAQARAIRSEILFWELYTQDVEEGYEVLKPALTFADTHTIDLGDLQVELVFVGKGHSLSDTVVYVPQEKLLVAGAVMHQHGPLPEIGEGSQLQDVLRHLAVLDRFLAKDVRIARVVPSQNPPLRKSDLMPLRDYYQQMLAGVQAAQQADVTLEQATQLLAMQTSFRIFRSRALGPWAWSIHERNVKNLWRILEEERQPCNTDCVAD